MKLDGQWNLNKTVGWGNEIVANVIATTIVPMKMDLVLFTIPAGYIEKGNKYWIDESINHLKDSLDSFPKPVPQNSPQKSHSKQEEKKTSPVKQSAIRKQKD